MQQVEQLKRHRGIKSTHYPLMLFNRMDLDVEARVDLSPAG